MKKKICLALALCLILFVFTGCGSKEPFGMKIEDLRTKLNSNIKTLGYDVTVPEFEIKYGTISTNGGAAKEDKENKFYGSSITEDFFITVSPPYQMAGSRISMVLVFPSNATDAEKAELIRDFTALGAAVITTIDPKADIKKIMETLSLDSSNVAILKYDSELYSYESNTRIDDKILNINQR